MLKTVLIFLAGAFFCMGAVGAILTQWKIAAPALLVGAAIVIVWALAFGTGRGSPVEPDRTDEDLEREKTMQFYIRTTRIPPH